MAHLPFAFSIHHFINSVGADAGFASIIGLAILVLLYFAQARETTTLRSRADDAEQRAGQLEARLAQIYRAQGQGVAQRAAPAPAARPLVNPVAARAAAQPVAAAAPRAAGAAAPPAVAAAAAQPTPSAPAGVGAPALAAATRLIPAPVAAAAAAPEATAAAVAPAAVAVAAAGPATAAGGLGAAGNGEHGRNGVAAEVPFDFDEHEPLAAAPPLSEPLPRIQLRQGAPAQRRQGPPSLHRSAPPRSRRPSGRGVPLIIGAVIAVAVIVGLVVVVSGGNGGKSAPTSPTRTTNAPSATVRHHTKTPAFNPSSVSVAVLNGTASSGLAAKIMQQLSGVGYKQGITPTNASSQTQQSTVVAFEPGHRNDALQVASALKLSPSAVQPIDTGTQNVACPQATACPVDVVVTVGQDLAGG